MESPLNKQFRDWYSIFAHRMNSTLGLFRILIQETLDSLDDKEKARSHLEQLESVAFDQLATLKKFSESLSLPTGSHIEKKSVNSVIREYLRENRQSIEKLAPSINIDLKLEPNLPDAGVNAQILAMLLDVLIENSIDAIKNRENGHISIQTIYKEKKIWIDVSDNGSGIPQTIAERLFQAGISSKPSGLGVGLYAAKQAATSLKGDLHLVKTDKYGTTFRIEMLTWDEFLDSSRKRRVIVVEDEPTWLRVVENLLIDLEFEVDTAQNVSDAKRLVNRVKYDIALLDVLIPAEEGKEAGNYGVSIIRYIREQNPQALIVVMSAYADMDILSDAIKAGVDEFINKLDFSKESFRRLLGKTMTRQETEHESIRQTEFGRSIFETLTMISHELRSPLVVIQRNAEALQLGSYGPLTADQNRAVETIRSITRREFILLDAHLDLNRIEGGTDKLNFQEFSLVTLIREEIDAHKSEAELKNIQIRSSFPEQEATVQIDVIRFRIALNPLMDNAIKFSPDGSSIFIKMQISERYVEVQISDQGPGINAAELDHLMNWDSVNPEGFTQRMRSSGLGLSIAKRMIVAHDGKLWIESDRENGTKVNFRLPIKR